MCRIWKMLLSLLIVCTSCLIAGCSGGDGSSASAPVNKAFDIGVFAELAKTEKLTEDELKTIIDQIKSTGIDLDRISSVTSKNVGSNKEILEFKNGDYRQTINGKERKFNLSLVLRRDNGKMILKTIFIENGLFGKIEIMDGLVGTDGIPIWESGKKVIDPTTVIIDKARHEKISSKVQDCYIEYLKNNNAGAELTEITPVIVKHKVHVGMFSESLVYDCLCIAAYHKKLYSGEETGKQLIKVELDGDSLDKNNIQVEKCSTGTEASFFKLLSTFSFDENKNHSSAPNENPTVQTEARQPNSTPSADSITTNNAKVTSKDDKEEAKKTFINFHEYITQKEYEKAYNCLSPEFRSGMDFDKWASGFATTVSSTPSNIKTKTDTPTETVFSYLLVAVDNPGGAQSFRGTVTLIKTNEGWKIDDIENKVKNVK